MRYTLAFMVALLGNAWAEEPPPPPPAEDEAPAPAPEDEAPPAPAPEDEVAGTAGQPSAGALKLEHAVNLGLGGPAVGIYSLNYELLYRGTHGIFVESVLVSRSVSENDALKGDSLGGYAGYRWHMDGKLEGLFFGANIGFFKSSLDGAYNDEIHPVDITTLMILPGLGKRWVWGSGITMVARAGIGISRHLLEAQGSGANAEAVLEEAEEQYKDDLIAYDGELSIGYSF